MNNRNQLERKIEASEKEIESLRSEIIKKEAFVQGLKEALKFMPRDGVEPTQQQALRSNSDMARVRDLLKKSGRPLHIDEILKGIGKDINKGNRASVAGSIATYARKGQIFTKTAPATFALIEVDQQRAGEHSAPPSRIKADAENGKREGFLV